MTYSNLKIAIDGPASSGKSTIAKLLAEEFDLVYVDTGAMYRALTLAALKKDVAIDDEQALIELLANIEIHFKRINESQMVYLNGKDITQEIRKHNVTKNVSMVSSFKKVREELVLQQRKIAKGNGVAMDGRDIGTVVLPNADVKIFLIASVDERAKRRHLENQEKGIESSLEKIKKEISARDEFDTNRENSPLRQAEDAIRLDTTSLSIEEVVKECKEIVKELV
ncbi:MAG: (d)CMP kinase [Atopostipes suicloacalis]|nr:(d)CMP kinase [Atopostipes suicloacalis]